MRTLDGALAVAIISLLGEGADHEPDPEGTFLLGAQGDILSGLQHCDPCPRANYNSQAASHSGHDRVLGQYDIVGEVYEAFRDVGATEEKGKADSER